MSLGKGLKRKRSRGTKDEKKVERIDELERKNEDSECSSSSDESDQGVVLTSSESKNEEIINVDFEFLDPRPSHFHSVKKLLTTSLLFKLPFSELAELIAHQVHIGTMIGVKEEEDVYGFITVLGMSAAENVVQTIVNYIRTQCPLDQKADLDSILRSKRVGLLLCGRISNLPLQVIPVLHSSLHKDIEWALTSADESKDVRESFQYDHFLIVSRRTIVKSKSKVNSRQEKSKYSQESTVYHHFEDEFMEAEASITFSCSQLSDNESHKDSIMKVMLIEREKHKAVSDSLSNLFDT